MSEIILAMEEVSSQGSSIGYEQFLEQNKKLVKEFCKELKKFGDFLKESFEREKEWREED